MHTEHCPPFGSSQPRRPWYALVSRPLAVIATALLLSGCSEETSLRSLMIVGGDYHDYKVLPSALADQLTLRGGMTVDITDDLTRLDAATLAPYRVLIFNTCHRPPLTDAFKHAVIHHVQSGGGLVVMHCSLWSYDDWPEWTPMVGGRVETHGKYTTYGVVVLDPAHATMAGLGNRFTITDEPYLVDQRDPHATVLIETAEPRHDREGKLRSGPDPQVWVKTFGKGRIFVTTFGHDAAVQESEPFITLMHNGIRWAGGLLEDAVHNELTREEKREGFKLLFNGRDLAGWKCDPKLWRVENGEIVGRGENLPLNDFVVTRDEYEDFHLRLSFRLIEGNSGVQFRTVPVTGNPDYRWKGYQAEIVGDKWANLYDFGGTRQHLLQWFDPNAFGDLVVPDGWNELEIVARGPNITTRINGQPSPRFTENDASYPRRGVIGIQLHRGETTEIHVRDIRIRPY